jgi:hypothetical protein
MTSRAALLLLLAAAAACARTAEPASCQVDAQCPMDARCAAGVCRADARPIAALRPIGTVVAFDLAMLDGSASRDPDDADVVAEHLWTVRAVDAPCAPPEIAGREAFAYVRFGCPGTYEVSLAVRDRLGVQSEPVVEEVRVAPATGDAAVLAGPDLATDHRCSGAPLVCRTETAVNLVAAAAQGLSVRWSVEPPVERPLDDRRRVRFVPSADVPSPRAIIETDGTAISGDWIFRVEARDGFGPLGSAATRVSVRNRAPVVTVEETRPFPHAFDAERSVFTSSGAVAWSAVDPDGDPVQVVGIWRHVGDGELATFDGDLDGTTATFAVEVPYAAPEDALHLRRGAGLSRRIGVIAWDANRTEARGAAEVEIGNRPPVNVAGAAEIAVPHRFDRERSRYVATVRGWTFADPDGDPLLGMSEGEGPCDTTVVEGSAAHVECAVRFDGLPALDRLVGPRTFAVRVRDGWDRADAAPVHTAWILNSPPALTRPATPEKVCLVPFPSGWGCWGSLHVSATTFDVTPAVTDPDGDPVLVTALPAAGGSAAPQRAVCLAPECVPFRFVQPPLDLMCTFVYSPSSALLASDGVSYVQLGVSPDGVRCG